MNNLDHFLKRKGREVMQSFLCFIILMFLKTGKEFI